MSRPDRSCGGGARWDHNTTFTHDECLDSLMALATMYDPSLGQYFGQLMEGVIITAGGSILEKHGRVQVRGKNYAYFNVGVGGTGRLLVK